MGFFTSEPSQYYQSILNTVPSSSADFADETSNRIRQQVAQQVSGRGMNVGRGAYTSLVAREEGQAARDREARKYQEAFQRAQLGMQAPVNPSAVSQFGSPLLMGLGYGMGPKVGAGMVSGAENLWDSSVSGLTDQYNRMTGNYGPGAVDQAWSAASAAGIPAAETPYSGLMGAVGNNDWFLPEFAQAFSGLW